MKPNVQPFLDPDSETYSYVIFDEVGGRAAMIDPVLDFDYKSGRTRTDGAQRLVDYVREQRLKVDWILETHAHADHLSAAPFMPDVGTARCDFPGGDARALYRSIQELLALPEATRLFICHDYPPKDRGHRCETTVGEQKRHNIHVHEGTTEQQFVTLRERRDATLEMPRLILPSVQVNIRAGQMPPAEDNGTVYLKVPVNVL